MHAPAQSVRNFSHDLLVVKQKWARMSQGKSPFTDAGMEGQKTERPQLGILAVPYSESRSQGLASQ